MSCRTVFTLCGTAAFLSLVTPTAHGQLVGHWKFDEAAGSTTADDSAGSNDGTVSGSAAFGATGVSGGAISFTDTGGSVVVPAAMLQSLANGTDTDLSVSLWMNATEFGNYKTLFDTPGRQLSMWINTANDGHVGIGGGGDSGVPVSPAWTTNEWQHIALTYDGGSNAVTLYRNGTPNGTLTLDGSTFNADWTIANNPSAGGTPYLGLMDDVQVYSHTLSQDEVNFLRDNPGVAVPEPSTLMLIPVAAMGLLSRRRRSA